MMSCDVAICWSSKPLLFRMLFSTTRFEQPNEAMPVFPLLVIVLFLSVIKLGYPYPA